MNFINFLHLEDTASTQSSSGESTGGATEKLMEIFKSPVLYIVLGAIVLLIIAFYLFRRFVSAKHNEVLVVVKHGKIVKLLKEGEKKHFLIPFVESVGASVSLNDHHFESDKLFINDGPDHLYKISYVLTYKVTDIPTYYKSHDNLKNVLDNKINDVLREYAESGNASVLIKEYRTRSNDIINLLNKELGQFGIEVSEYKVKFIQPLGK